MWGTSALGPMRLLTFRENLNANLLSADITRCHFAWLQSHAWEGLLKTKIQSTPLEWCRLLSFSSYTLGWELTTMFTRYQSDCERLEHSKAGTPNNQAPALKPRQAGRKFASRLEQTLLKEFYTWKEYCKL